VRSEGKSNYCYCRYHSRRGGVTDRIIQISGLPPANKAGFVFMNRRLKIVGAIRRRLSESPLWLVVFGHPVCPDHSIGSFCACFRIKF
jgi:hypothetical protein